MGGLTFRLPLAESKGEPSSRRSEQGSPNLPCSVRTFREAHRDLREVLEPRRLPSDTARASASPPSRTSVTRARRRVERAGEHPGYPRSSESNENDV
jgi:hypothetical protein